jgi:Ser/Thr protein kinase RdoA (MazF antagonist)
MIHHPHPIHSPLHPTVPQAVEAALPWYGLSGARVKFVQQSFNTVFRVEAGPEDQYALRLHRFNARGVEEMRSEFVWLEAIRRAGEVLASEPLTNLRGEFVTELPTFASDGPRYCTVLRWHPGETLAVVAPDEHYRMMGELMARLHHHAADYMPAPGFARPRRDRHYPWECVESIRHAADRQILPGEELLVLDAVADHIERTMRAIGEGPEDFGLIHGDLHGDNVLFHEGTIRAIDFEGCVWGHYLYDIAVALFYLPRGKISAFLRGYRSQHDWTAEQWQAVESFYALRILDQLAYHYSSDHSRSVGRSLLRKAMPTLVGRFLEGIPFLPELPGAFTPARLGKPKRRRTARTRKERLATDSAAPESPVAGRRALSRRKKMRLCL